MTFQQLKYLLEVHKTGSISKAAENLFVSRPSVSLSISSLEEELGYPIFIRSQTGLLPSPKGQSVIKYANSICQTYEQIKSINTKTQTLVRLSVIKYAPVDNAVIRLLDEYKDRDDVTFSISTSNSTRSKDIALANLDLSISSKVELSNNKVNSEISRWNLYSEELARIPMGICIGPGHHLYNKEDLSPADFKTETIVDTLNHAWTSTGLLKSAIGADPKNTISLYNNGVLKDKIIRDGLAYAIRRLPNSGNLIENELRYLPLDNLYHRVIYVIDTKTQPHEAVVRFIELLKDELQK